MKHLYILITLVISSISYGQDLNSAFEASKGKWKFPISDCINVDTTMNDCYGNKTSSYSTILTSKKSSEVRALEKGIVHSVFSLDDTAFTVIVKSGSYLLAYSGVFTHLNKGDTVYREQVIGYLTKRQKDNSYDLFLALTKNLKPVNINNWFDYRTAHNKCICEKHG